MKDCKGAVVVVAEILEGKKVASSFFEALHLAHKIADVYGVAVHALILGHDIEDVAEEMRHFAIDTIYVAADPHLAVYHPEYYLSAVHQAYKTIAPIAFVMGNTLQAIDLAPRMAFALDAGLITDCTGYQIDSGNIIFLKPVFSSHILASYRVEKPFIVTMRPKSFEPLQRLEAKQGKIEHLQVKLENVDVRITVTSRVVYDHAGIKVDDAEIIVSGGRGIGSADGFNVLADLADTLGAAVGASRPPIDTGWIAADAQIGQTGAIVAPAVYFAIGISGAIQHLAGMGQSKKIIAINKDAEASIFKVADYGVVGIYEEIVPAITQAFREHSKA